ncbi:MAG: hypothetical protein IKO80_09600 [Lachnospiraceae bacterium]|nr:hypothetical protein [Lachnospiraceae bacterium]
MGIIIGIVIAVIIAWIILAMLKGQMRPVARKHDAAQYTQKEDVSIRVKEDQYLRTETKVQPIERAQNNASAPMSVAAGAKK